MDFWISDWISGFHSEFLDFTVDFWISQWISGFHSGFLDFSLDFWISGFQFGFLPTVYEISFVTDPSANFYKFPGDPCPQTPLVLHDCLLMLLVPSYVRSVNMVSRMHTHASCNAVPLVAHRLAPIIRTSYLCRPVAFHCSQNSLNNWNGLISTFIIICQYNDGAPYHTQHNIPATWKLNLQSCPRNWNKLLLS